MDSSSTADGGGAVSRTEVLAGLGARRTPLTLAQIRSTTRQLRSLTESLVPTRAAILHTYTTQLLQPYWEFESRLQGLELSLYDAPYGSLLQEMEPGSGLSAANPDFVYVFLRWEDLEPRLSSPLSGLTADEGDEIVAAAVAMVSGLLRQLRRISTATAVVTLLPRMWGPELGLYDPMAPQSDSELRHRIKVGIVRDLETITSALFCDLDEIASEIGRQSLFDARLWETSRFPFSVAGAQLVVRRLVAYAAARLLPKAKVVVLDADNTLWGGIVGEDGLAGIALGPDYPGSVYVSFQRRLLELGQRGFLLALCSKNNPQDVAEVLAEHPHQVLRADHFAATRVNWNPKVDNLTSLAEELNLGLESFIFVDDSSHEVHAVRQSLPQVTVVQVPSDVLELPYVLDAVARLEVTSLTDEDRSRTRMYARERQRKATAESFTDIDEYLASLEMVMRVGFDAEQNVARIAQLTQKTNQFNLTTRRYSEAEILGFMRDPDCLVAAFSLADIFGDSGLVGVAILKGLAGTDVEWDTLLMSCRIIGRRAEQAFVHHIARRLHKDGVKRVRSRYSPTAKNEMVRGFWPTVGFTPVEQPEPAATEYVRDLPIDTPDAPPPIRIVEATEQNGSSHE